MGNSSAFGSLARKAIGWVIVAVVAILLFKFVVAAVAGIVQLAASAIAAGRRRVYAVVWAVRKL